MTILEVERIDNSLKPSMVTIERDYLWIKLEMKETSQVLSQRYKGKYDTTLNNYRPKWIIYKKWMDF